MKPGGDTGQHGYCFVLWTWWPRKPDQDAAPLDQAAALQLSVTGSCRFGAGAGAGAPAFDPPARSQLSKCLGNLAQARGAIRVKSAGARRLLDHPIGRNQHGDRVGSGVILGQPGQRAMRSAA